MPSCSAFGCKNRSTQGYLMKVFPRNPLRRALWAAKVKRKDWFPNDHSYLCEVHFDNSQWKPVTSNGKRRLKDTAVPTLFCFTEKQSGSEKESTELKSTNPNGYAKTRSYISVLTSENKDLKEATNCLNHDDRFSNDEICDPNIPSEHSGMYEVYSNSTSDCETDAEDNKIHVQPIVFENTKNCSKNDKIKALEKYVSKLENQLKIMKKDMIRKNERLQLYKKKLRKARIEKKHIEITDYEKMLKSIFNNDQIAALYRKSTNYMKWCNDTIEKAIKIKTICGVDGYNLIRNVIPLPSIRTLQRHLERLQKYPDDIDGISSCSDNE